MMIFHIAVKYTSEKQLFVQVPYTLVHHIPHPTFSFLSILRHKHLLPERVVVIPPLGCQRQDPSSHPSGGTQ